MSTYDECSCRGKNKDCDKCNGLGVVRPPEQVAPETKKPKKNPVSFKKEERKQSFAPKK
jgi:hypothetical protein